MDAYSRFLRSDSYPPGSLYTIFVIYIPEFNIMRKRNVVGRGRVQVQDK
jgi:hypothetical protein